MEMKKSIVATVIMVIIFGFIFALEYKVRQDTYTENAVITADYNGWCLALDDNGNVWEFDDDNFHMGDIVILTIYNNCSPQDVKDDIIKGVDKRQHL